MFNMENLVISKLPPTHVPLTRVVLTGKVRRRSSPVYGYLTAVDNNDNLGEWIPLTKEIINIGRKTTNNLVLNTKTVSSHHCRIIFNCEKRSEEQFAHIVDLNSTNATRLGLILDSDISPNRKCQPFEAYALRSGVYITIANQRFRFFANFPQQIEMIEM